MFSDWSLEVQRAWAGAWLDTEGCIGILSSSAGSVNRKKSINMGWSLRVVISQNDTMPLIMLQKKYGGCLNHKAGNTWSLILSTRVALRFLEDVQDYVVVKRKQVELALEFYSTFDGKKSPRHRNAPGINERREALSLAIKAENQKWAQVELTAGT